MASADVVIIGGGIMGSATAMHLAGTGEVAPGRILVIEQDPSYQRCATTRSAGGVRQQFSTPECIAMSRATVEHVRDTGLDLGWREQGYLMLASAAGAAGLTSNAELQRRHGADTQLLPPAALVQAFAWLDVTDIAAGGFGRSGEGWLDGALLLQHFRARAEAGGARWTTGAVAAIELSGDRVTAVTLADGRRIACGHVVNAAGPQAGAVARLAGIALPVEPRKRLVFVLDCREAGEDLRAAPLTVDPSGVWFRPEGRRFICGASPTSDAEEPDPADLDTIDQAVFDELIWPVLAARVPAFAAVKVTSAWAGHYDYNVLDQNAVIGPHDEVSNLHFCNGFSGHGLQHAYAAGRAVAELILHGRFLTLDLSRLGYDRIRQGRPLVESNVI